MTTTTNNNTPVPQALKIASVLLVLLAGLLMFAGVASAGEYVQVLCRNPDGSSAPSQGVSSFTTGSPGFGSSTSTSCTTSNPLFAAIGAGGGGESVGSNEVLRYQPPAGSTIVGGSANVVMYADGSGPGASGTAIAFNPTYDAAGVFFQCSSGQPPCSPGSYDFAGTIGLLSNRGGELFFSAGCGGSPGQSCTEHPDMVGGFDAYALLEVNWADVRLSNTATPGASNITGALLSPGARGTQDIALTATDPGGPGVYALTVKIDTTTLYNTTPDTNSGHCVPVGGSGAALMFDFSQPCKTSESADVPVNTTGVVDGPHTLKVIVRDAAGNESTVYDNTITTLNAPQNTVLPGIVTPGQVLTGTQLTSHSGTWSAPAGTGSVTYAYQWQDCDTNGLTCHAIAGAEAATYTPAQADVGHTLRLQVTAADTDGFSSATSSPSSVVEAPQGSSGAPSGPGSNPGENTNTTGNNNGGSGGSGGAGGNGTPGVPGGAGSNGASGAPGSQGAAGVGAPNGTIASSTATIHMEGPRTVKRSYTHSKLTLNGRLLDAQGQPISGASLEVLAQTLGASTTRLVARARTSGDGSFNAPVPAGSSRLITVAYRAYTQDPVYAAKATVLESVEAGIQLHITPRRISPTGTILLTGRVLGAIPRHGVLMELLVKYRGSMESLGHGLRTSRSGRFKMTYRFQGARGSFPIRAAVPGGQAGFPYTTGTTKAISVRSS